MSALQTAVELTDGYYATDGHFTMNVLKVVDEINQNMQISKQIRKGIVVVVCGQT